MKKIVSVIICFALCLLLGACNDNATSPKYESFICDYTNDGFISYAEKEWWLGGYETNLSAPAERQVTFDGVSYYAVYKKSLLPGGRHSKIDKYYSADGNIRLSFDSLTGNFSGIFFSEAIVANYGRADIEDSHDYALQEAKLLASKYIKLDEYILEETEYIRYKGQDEDINIGQSGEGRVIVYEFTFTKKQGGFGTSDRVDVSITSKGDLMDFSIYDNGLFSQHEVPEIDKEELRKSIDEKLKDIYSDYEYSYNIVEQTLTLSPNEKVIVVSRIELAIKLPAKDGYETAVILVTEVE